MREAIYLAIFAAILVGLVDHLFGSYLLSALGYILSRLIPGLLPRSIRGQWITTFPFNGEPVEERVRAKQLVDRVWGTITLDLKAKHRKYHYHGTIRGDVFVATYELAGSPGVMDRGSFTLKLNNDGDAMLGCFSWTCDKTGLVRSDKYEWKKVQTD